MKQRDRMFSTLGAMGFSHEDSAALIRAERVLHTWAEHECNGVIQRNEVTGVPYWFDDRDGHCIGATSDREAGALKRVHAIAAKYALQVYHQPDPRGCALYLIRPGDVLPDHDVGSCYSRGVAVHS